MSELLCISVRGDFKIVQQPLPLHPSQGQVSRGEMIDERKDPHEEDCQWPCWALTPSLWGKENFLFNISQLHGLQENYSAHVTPVPGFWWEWEMGGCRDGCQIPSCLDPRWDSKVPAGATRQGHRESKLHSRMVVLIPSSRSG